MTIEYPEFDLALVGQAYMLGGLIFIKGKGLYYGILSFGVFVGWW